MFVVLQTSFLGDMILTTPLIDRLAARGAVDVVATPANAPLLANHPGVRRVIVFDKRAADAGLAGLRRVAGILSESSADTAYLAQGSLRTAALARLAGIPQRIGFASSPGRVLYTTRVPFRGALHHGQRLWQLASEVHDASAPTVRPSLYPGAADVAQVNALLQAHDVDASVPLIALAPGSVWATKRWPSFDALAAGIARHASLRAARIVVLGAAGDAPLARSIAGALRTAHTPTPIDATGRLSLLASAALLARAALLITNDSAPLHLASAMNTPTVALFGPTVPAFGFGPLAHRSTVVEQPGLGCRPCHAHGPQRCPLGHWKCMQETSPERVLDEMLAFGDPLLFSAHAP